ncbi:hypothetical protein [Streptomyces sp. NPDC057412]|uniref:hypothetical protein n=1 Tax=Streptomyces sp. NPDC057412 TaxID=3346123 RepID=UPI00368757E7
MTTHTTHQPSRTPTTLTHRPHPHLTTPPHDPQTPPTPTLPPAFEAFCALNRTGYLDYARAHLPPHQAHHLVCHVLGELAVHWSDIVSHPNPAARAWSVLRTRIQAAAPAPDTLDTCPAQQYDALVLQCRLGYSSTAAASMTGLDPSKIRYLLLSATAAHRHAVRHLHPHPTPAHAA